MREFLQRWVQRRPVLVIVLMGTYSAQSLLITASKRQGDFSYDATVAVLLAEVLKLGFALAMLAPEVRSRLRPSTACLPFAISAVLYALQNRLVFEALRHISPPEYQLLNNMKLFTTSAVYRVAMRRQLKVLQWLALLLLSLGMALATQPTGDGNLHAKGDISAGTGVWTGLGIMVLVSWLSAFAGVLNEWLIKRSADVLEANVWLYAFGAVACGCQLACSDGGWIRLTRLEGFSGLTWLVVLCNAVLGQCIAFIFRYADSIVKLYAVCAAMAFTTAMSVIFFSFQVQFNMVAGYITCAIAMCLHYAPAEVLLKTDTAVLQDLGCVKRENGVDKSS